MVLISDSVELSTEDPSGSTAATNAIDGNLDTVALSECKLDMDIYYLIKYTNIECIKEIMIYQAKLDQDAIQMNGTTITISNSETGEENDCGVLITTDDYTVEDQTYSFTCDFNGGDQIQLLVNHKSSEYNDIMGLCYQNSSTKFNKTVFQKSKLDLTRVEGTRYN